jgi:hypothetical protein
MMAQVVDNQDEVSVSFTGHFQAVEICRQLKPKSELQTYEPL